MKFEKSSREVIPLFVLVGQEKLQNKKSLFQNIERGFFLI